VKSSKGAGRSATGSVATVSFFYQGQSEKGCPLIIERKELDNEED